MYVLPWCRMNSAGRYISLEEFEGARYRCIPLLVSPWLHSTLTRMSEIREAILFFLRGHYAQVTLMIATCVIQVFMWLYALSRFVNSSPESRKGRLPYIIVSFLIMCLSTVCTIMESTMLFDMLLDTIPGDENAEATLGVLDTYLNSSHWIIGGLMWDIAIRIADGMLVYRCYIVWFNHRWVSAVPACLFLVGLGIGARTYIPFEFYDAQLNTADFAISIVLNLLVTILISVRLIRAHSRAASLWSQFSDKAFLGITTIFIESAAPLAIFGLGAIITRSLVPSVPSVYRTASVFERIYIIFSILSPQWIMFRVALGRSWATREETNEALSKEIRFAHSDRSSDVSSIGEV
ncbi:hypothetical protein BKA70DRAFT_1188890 [Coprinopsis sp. MPI-PUGE-AT-0042]|nr:hypothetical protein BKA70DRAFT_1188890 [Coprinopsis sp. MPI-PUGE-AT-0042]